MSHDSDDIRWIRAGLDAPRLKRVAQIVEAEVGDLGPHTRGLEAAANPPEGLAVGLVEDEAGPRYNRTQELEGRAIDRDPASPLRLGILGRDEDGPGLKVDVLGAEL